MTARETLEKYGLKADIKSIKERFNGFYFQGTINGAMQKALEKELLVNIIANCRNADFIILCELAEKGERANPTEKDLVYQCKHSYNGDLTIEEDEICVNIFITAETTFDNETKKHLYAWLNKHTNNIQHCEIGVRYDTSLMIEQYLFNRQEEITEAKGEPR